MTTSNTGRRWFIFSKRRASPAQPRRALVVSLLAALLLAGCTGEQSMFDPSGSGARSVDRLWLLMFSLGTAVFLLVLAVLAWAIFRGRRDDESSALSKRGRMRVVTLGGILLPLVILAVVFSSTLQSLREVAGIGSPDAVVIDVVGHQFWWEVRYPGREVVTANEIVIPTGEPVELNLTSNDVIHAFWVPRLHGKIDMMAGTTTTITMEAEEAGTYRGQCAQFCGVQHANMAFTVIAVEAQAFHDWIDARAAPASVPPEGSLIERGEQVFLGSVCVYCHTVSGTNASGTLGPDLTHFASRQTIAAGTLENNTGNLAAWILDPQSIKPGNLMPGIAISGYDLEALLAYLESLK